MKNSIPNSSAGPAKQVGAGAILPIAVIAAVLLAIGIWYFFFSSPSEVTAPSAPLPPTAKQAKPDSARDIIEEIKSSPNKDYDAAYEQAASFLADGDVADAQLLYFFAAREGHGPSALTLAKLYDPVGFDPNNSLMDDPDAFQAYKWYSRALEAGESSAAERLSELKAWTEAAAADGDLDAEQLLLQWEQ